MKGVEGKMIHFNSEPALKTTFVGFGQGGCRMVDIFASFKNVNGQPYYSTFGLNSTRNDFMELKHIPENNLLSLDLNGFGKDPIEAIDVLGMHEPSINKINQFAEDIFNKEDDVVVFCTTLGGGTGTSTIIKTVEAYIAKHITPNIDKMLGKMLEREGITLEQFANSSKDIQLKTRIQALETCYRFGHIKKIGIIAALPVRSDGPRTLKYVNQFANYLWNLSKNPLKGIAFICFPDNQKFYDDWSKDKEKNMQKNYRDYANVQTAEVFHELNLGTNMGGTDVTFDPKDFRKVMLEGQGCLNINRVAKNVNQITSGKDMYELLSDAFNGSLLHDPIRLQSVDEETSKIVHQKVFNVGLLAVTNNDIKNVGSAFLDEVKEKIATEIFVNGSIFTGNVQMNRTSFQAVAYAFYKSQGLPERLSTGLVNELEKYREQKISTTYKTDTIKKADNFITDHDLSDIQEVSLSDSLGSGLGGLGFLKDNIMENENSEEVIQHNESNDEEEVNPQNDLSWLKDW